VGRPDIELVAVNELKELADRYLFIVDRARVSVDELAEWVADESRYCPAVDFHVELPSFGALTPRMDGGAGVKQFIAAELGLCASIING
jgi:hypothetical protein